MCFCVNAKCETGMVEKFCFQELELKGAYLIKPFFATDNRGALLKEYNIDTFKESGIVHELKEVFYTISERGVIRATHFQLMKQQAKLVRCISGHVYDVIVADRAYSESSFAEVAFGYTENIQKGDDELLKVIQDTAEKLNYPIITDIIHSSDVFYRTKGDALKDVRDVYGCVAVEMESFALFANARKLGKKAACILTVSDSFITHEETTAEERQTSFNKMMEIALETAATID